MDFPSDLFSCLQSETVDDHVFDRIYPGSIRKLASVHWTPVRIARRAAELLADGSDARILDVGAGAGKFCLVGAASTSATFVGIERRENLIRTAQNIAAQWKWPRVEFIHGDAFNLDWSGFNGVYLFNPFAEHLFRSIQMDRQVELGLEAHQRAVDCTLEKLGDLPAGARVVSLNGFGGEMPELFRLELEEAQGNAVLKFWVKLPLVTG